MSLPSLDSFYRSVAVPNLKTYYIAIICSSSVFVNLFWLSLFCL